MLGQRLQVSQSPREQKEGRGGRGAPWGMCGLPGVIPAGNPPPRDSLGHRRLTPTAGGGSALSSVQRATGTHPVTGPPRRPRAGPPRDRQARACATPGGRAATGQDGSCRSGRAQSPGTRCPRQQHRLAGGSQHWRASQGSAAPWGRLCGLLPAAPLEVQAFIQDRAFPLRKTKTHVLPSLMRGE